MSRVALAAVCVALLLLAVPFAIGIKLSFFSDEATELERAALAAAVQVGPDFTAGDPVELPTPLTDGRVAVYDNLGKLRAGAGPSAIDDLTQRARAGKVVQGRVDGELVVAVPVFAAEQVIGVVRSASPTTAVWTRVLLAWLGVAAVTIFALLVGLAVAVRQASRLAKPLESLASVARSVTAGDLTARATPSGIPEIDTAATAQNAMVARLSTTLDHARHFTADASHQLRTPLTGLRLILETALHDADDPRTALKEALDRTDELRLTVDQVLSLSQLSPTSPESFGTIEELLATTHHHWHGLLATDGRRIDFVTTHTTASRQVPLHTCRQILDVLIHNAQTHGHGTIQVTSRDTLGAVAIEVSDEGHLETQSIDLFRRGTTTAPGTGLGLAVARAIAESQGARLRLTSRTPTAFALLLPAQNPIRDSAPIKCSTPSSGVQEQ
ncbi:HAMP domain-containing sensor histidine kinase [Kribbella koreensis]|uniref:histidine kinase n=1 Tax=Kribbella koreensis TaxID=57909 RepID=A0ABN1QTH7_9ACTN